MAQQAIDGNRLESIDVVTLKGYFHKLPITKGKIAKLVKKLEDLRVRGMGGDVFSLLDSKAAAAPATAAPAAAEAGPAAAEAARAPTEAAPVSTSTSEVQISTRSAHVPRLDVTSCGAMHPQAKVS